MRQSLIEQKRDEIAAGHYDSPCRTAITAEKLVPMFCVPPSVEATERIAEAEEEGAAMDLQRPDRFDVE